MMKINPSWFMFFCMTLMGTIMVMSSNNWYMTWMGFELSLMGFLPMFSTSSSSIESMIKYFLVQASASSMFIFSYLISYSCMSSNMIIYAMMMKLGAFPFYQWMPMVMSGISWTSCMILTTIQKLSPVFVLISLDIHLQAIVILVLSVLNIGTGAILAYNQSLMRPLMAYSSIAHTGWLISMIPFNTKVALLYILIYFSMNIILFVNLQKANIDKVVSGTPYNSNFNTINFLLISIAGIPPLPLFFLKLMILSTLSSYTLLIFLMVAFACLSVYFYLTFVIPSLAGMFNTLNKGMSYSNSWAGLIICLMWVVMMMT